MQFSTWLFLLSFITTCIVTVYKLNDECDDDGGDDGDARLWLFDTVLRAILSLWFEGRLLVAHIMYVRANSFNIITFYILKIDVVGFDL